MTAWEATRIHLRRKKLHTQFRYVAATRPHTLWKSGNTNPLFEKQMESWGWLKKGCNAGSVKRGTAFWEWCRHIDACREGRTIPKSSACPSVPHGCHAKKPQAVKAIPSKVLRGLGLVLGGVFIAPVPRFFQPLLVGLIYLKGTPFRFLRSPCVDAVKCLPHHNSLPSLVKARPWVLWSGVLSFEEMPGLFGPKATTIHRCIFSAVPQKNTPSKSILREGSLFLVWLAQACSSRQRMSQWIL